MSLSFIYYSVLVFSYCLNRFVMAFSLEPNMSMVTWTPDPKNESVFIPTFPASTHQTKKKDPHEKEGGRNVEDEFQARIDAMLDEYPESE